MNLLKGHIQPSYILLSLIAICVIGVTNAQLDTKHYIPPMFGKEDLGEHYLVLGTPVNSTFNVTVKDGAGNLIATIPISSSSSSTTLLGSEFSSPFMVSPMQLNTPLSSNKGLILSAPEPFYASVRVTVSAQAGSLTSKGEKAALGREFRTGHMYNNNGYTEGKSNVISFMATQNNTTVTVSDINPGVIFNGTATSGTPETSNDFTVNLDAGESYVIAANFNNPNAITNMNGVNGTKISSNKDIVVNCGTWLGGNARSGTSPSGTVLQGRDIGIDQIVPKENIGDEYVLIKGYGVDNERVIVVAAENNTQLFINGSSNPIATLANAGDFYVIEGSSFSGNDNLYLKSSQPVFVTQTLNGGDGYSDDNERQAGINFLPPVKCTGSKEVTIPDAAFIGTAYVSIIAEAGASVTVNGNNVGAGDPVPGTSNYVTYKLSGYSGDVKIASSDLIRVALLNLNGNIGAAGYFSGFSKEINLSASYLNNDQYADEEIVEGCGLATITIERSSLFADVAETININLAGSATEGVDYSNVPNQVMFNVGQTTTSFQIEAFADNLTEGDENVIIELTVAGDACESDELEFVIKDVEDIQVMLDDSNVQCPGDDIILQAQVSGGAQPYSYLWNTGETTESISVSPTITQTYAVLVTDVCKTDTVNASALVEVPTYELNIFSSNDTAVLCPYTDMIIASEVTGGLPAYQYEWYANNEFQGSGPVLSISPPVTTQFIVHVSDQCGLNSTDTVNISVITPLMELEVPTDIQICPYDSTDIWVNVSGGLPPFEYYWQHSGESTNMVTVNPGWSTNYTVTVQDACATYSVDGHPKVEVLKPEADFYVLSSSQMENLPIYFANNSSGGNFWNWNFGNGETSTQFAPGTTFSEDGVYEVMLIATNNLGCKDTAIKEIYIKPEFYFFAPNAFTPNGDGQNSLYEVSVIGATEFEFYIYNRWGENILYTTDQYFQWDGTYKNVLVEDGVYIYKCKIIGEDLMPRTFSGHITILK